MFEIIFETLLWILSEELFGNLLGRSFINLFVLFVFIMQPYNSIWAILNSASVRDFVGKSVSPAVLLSVEHSISDCVRMSVCECVTVANAWRKEENDSKF